MLHKVYIFANIAFLAVVTPVVVYLDITVLIFERIGRYRPPQSHRLAFQSLFILLGFIACYSSLLPSLFRWARDVIALECSNESAAFQISISYSLNSVSLLKTWCFLSFQWSLVSLRILSNFLYACSCYPICSVCMYVVWTNI